MGNLFPGLSSRTFWLRSSLGIYWTGHSTSEPDTSTRRWHAALSHSECQSLYKVLPGISGQVIVGTTLDPSTPPRMSHRNHGIHGPQPNPQNFFPFTPPPFRWRRGTQLPGWGCGDPCFPWIPWPFTPGAACVAMASDFRDGGAVSLTGTSFPTNTGRTLYNVYPYIWTNPRNSFSRQKPAPGERCGRIVASGGIVDEEACGCHIWAAPLGTAGPPMASLAARNVRPELAGYLPITPVPR